MLQVEPPIPDLEKDRAFEKPSVAESFYETTPSKSPHAQIDIIPSPLIQLSYRILAAIINPPLSRSSSSLVELELNAFRSSLLEDMDKLRAVKEGSFIRKIVLICILSSHLNLKQLRLNSDQFRGIILAFVASPLVDEVSSIDLSDNKLLFFDAKMGDFIGLEILNLSYNKLGDVSKIEIEKLYNLKALDLSYNFLDFFAINPDRLINLQRLNLAGNRFIDIPVEIFALTRLRELDLHNNFLTSVSDEIKKLMNLRNLNLSYNQLINFPIAICVLTNLEKLSLCCCELESIPDELHSMHLMECDLSENLRLQPSDADVN